MLVEGPSLKNKGHQDGPFCYRGHLKGQHSPDQSKVDSNLTKSPSWHSVQDTPCSCSPPLPAQTLPQNGACGSREDLTEPDTCPKQNRSAIFVEKRRLRQPGRPHRAQYMWKVTGTQFLQKKKAPAAAGRPHRA